MKLTTISLNIIRISLLILTILSLYSCKSTKQSDLTLVSYNIRHGRGTDQEVNIARTAKVLQQFDADLIALQEVDNNCLRSNKQHLAKELSRELKMEYSFQKFMDYQGGEYGIAVLSRFPIRKIIRHQLPEGDEPRCAAEVQINFQGKNLSFISIHNDWKNIDIRFKQYQALNQALEEYTHPIILAGDFNGEKQDPSMIFLEKQGWSILDKEGANHKTYPSADPKSEIDFFLTKNLKLKDYNHYVHSEKIASDHKPIIAKITID